MEATTTVTAAPKATRKSRKVLSIIAAIAIAIVVKTLVYVALQNVFHHDSHPVALRTFEVQDQTEGFDAVFPLKPTTEQRTMNGVTFKTWLAETNDYAIGLTVYPKPSTFSTGTSDLRTVAGSVAKGMHAEITETYDVAGKDGIDFSGPVRGDKPGYFRGRLVAEGSHLYLVLAASTGDPVNEFRSFLSTFKTL